MAGMVKSNRLTASQRRQRASQRRRLRLAVKRLARIGLGVLSRKIGVPAEPTNVVLRLGLLFSPANTEKP